MNAEQILLERFILNTPATNQEHIEAIGWVQRMAFKIEQLQKEKEELLENASTSKG